MCSETFWGRLDIPGHPSAQFYLHMEQLESIPAIGFPVRGREVKLKEESKW